MRNIRHKNEQVYLAPVPRGFDIYRVSSAAKLTGLDLPPRRDIKVIAVRARRRRTRTTPLRPTVTDSSIEDATSAST